MKSKEFLRVKCLKINLLLCLQQKTTLLLVIFFTYSHLFVHKIYSLQPSNFSIFLPWQIKCRDNYMKMHCASAFPWQCFSWGWLNFILRALVFTSAMPWKILTWSKHGKLLPLLFFTKNKKYYVYNYCCTTFAVQILDAMQCALFSCQNLWFKNNFGCFIWVQK